MSEGREGRQWTGFGGVWLAVLGVMAVGTMGVAAAEHPRPATRTQRSPQAPAPPQGFRADVDRVRVDVIVNDKRGRFVDDLTVADFVLLEDGEPQTILGVQLVDLATGKIERVALFGGAPPDAEARAAAVEPALVAAGGGEERAALAEQDPEVEGMGALVFVIEAAALGYWERRRFVSGWVDSLEHSDGFLFPRAVYVLDHLGRIVQPMVPLTRDVTTLQRISRDVLEAVYADELGSAGFADPFDTFFSSFERRSWRTLRTLKEICETLGDRRGRKALVWISTGVDLQDSPSNSDTTALRLMDDLVEAANTSGVSIYAVDPTLVTRRAARRPWTRITSRIGPAEAIRRDPLETAVWRFDASRDSLHAAARGTGGKAYPFQTRIEETLQEIERDTSRFYLLTYAPPPPRADGRYHEVEVRVDREDIEVRARAGYIDRS